VSSTCLLRLKKNNVESILVKWCRKEGINGEPKVYLPLSHWIKHVRFGKACWSHDAGKRESLVSSNYPPSQKIKNVWFGKPCLSHDAGKKGITGELYLPTHSQDKQCLVWKACWSHMMDEGGNHWWTIPAHPVTV
jgi:hypothetical protein